MDVSKLSCQKCQGRMPHVVDHVNPVSTWMCVVLPMKEFYTTVSDEEFWVWW